MNVIYNDYSKLTTLTPEMIAEINKQKICLEQFIESIKDELTVSCAIPLNLPVQRITNIIDKAKQWFYKNYEYSVEENIIILDEQLFSTSKFLKEDFVQLPPTIFSVYNVIELRENSSLSNYISGDTDFSIDKILFNTYYQDNSINLARSSERLMYYTITESLIDMVRQITQNKLTFYFNTNTKRLKFLGEKPNKSIVIETYRIIEDCNLFNDELFYRYVTAQCKVQLARILGTFAYNLPGNITINFDMIQSEGNEELDRIREEIKSEEGVDYFFTS